MTFMGTPAGVGDGKEGTANAGARSAREAARRLHGKLTEVVRTERRAVRELALGLAEMERTGGYRELGYAGLAEYGERAFGLGFGKAGQLATLGRRLPELPALDAALVSGALGWTKARTVGQVATPETVEAWVALALVSTSRELERSVWDSLPGKPPGDTRHEVEPPRYVHARFRLEMDHFELLMRALERIRQDMGGVDLSASQLLLELAERELARGDEGERASPPPSDSVGPARPEADTGSDSDSVDRHTGSDSASDSDSDSDSDSGSGSGSASPPLEHVSVPRSSGGENAYRVNTRIIAHRCPDCEKRWAETLGGRFELTRESRERLECDHEEVAGDDAAGTPGHVTRSIPPATRRRVLVRDGGHCMVPGCRNHRYLDLHHILPRSRGGDHSPSNLVTVCSTHHELLHRDVVQVIRNEDGSLSWERGEGEPLGLVLVLEGERAEIDHTYMSEFDGPPGTWCLIEALPEHSDGEHVFVESAPDAPPPGRFPRGRTSFLIGDGYRMARRDEYLPMPTGLG